ncbi:hypothetical protein SVAN01_05969 [Stagonosporopsis vannaccii]|nr:hypothetical protein SVAN01_05969 [Stagonosporopsis vannaccii]
MVSRGEYQRQLAGLVAAANANNLKFGDILPDDLKAYFQEMTELKHAQEYIRELEEHEKALEAENDNLKKDLGAKQMEIDNLPTEHEARLVELHQTERQVAMWKSTFKDSEKRADRYRKQLDDVVRQQQATASAATKIEDLNTQIGDQQVLIDKLIAENQKYEMIFEQLRESDLKALERKEKQLAKKDEMLAELRQQVKDAQLCYYTFGDQLFDNNDDAKTLVDDTHNDTPKETPDDNESLALQEQNIDVLQQNLALLQDNQALEDQYVMVKIELSELKAAYDFSPAQDYKTQLFAAAISEIKTVNRFYTAAFKVLNGFAKAFHTTKTELSSAGYISDQLDMAQDALVGYSSVKQVVRAITDVPSLDTDQVALYQELDSLGASAADLMSSLEIFSTGFWRFLSQLSDDPKLLSQLNGALCDAGQPCVVDLCICD